LEGIASGELEFWEFMLPKQHLEGVDDCLPR
jgi:hypothetical protein